MHEGGLIGRSSLLGISLLAVALGSCFGVDPHPPDVAGQADPCDVEPVSIKAGAERVASSERTASGLMPSIPDARVAWHCGTPDTPTAVIAVAAVSLHPYAPSAPPLG